MPRWRTSALCSVCRGERVAVGLGRPAAVAEHRGHTNKRLLIGHPLRLAFEHDVDALETQRQGARRSGAEIARLARSRAAGEVQVAVVVSNPYARGVRPPVPTDGAQKAWHLGRYGPATDRIVDTAPRHRVL